MLSRLHRDEAGKFNVVHVILLFVVGAALYGSIMYVPPYMQYFKIKTAAEELAKSGSTVDNNDERLKNWYDSRMKEIGAQYPMSEHLTYYRADNDNVTVGFEYEYEINHFWSDSPHILHFAYQCDAHLGHCN